MGNSIPEKIFKSYDIRGIYPSELNEVNIVFIVQAIYKFFQEVKKKTDLKIVVSRDMRLSSPSLFNMAIKTLIEAGAQVIDIGLSSTPTFYFTVFNYDYNCGIQISASHNPKDYNGIKIVYEENRHLVKVGKSTGMEKIKKMSLEGVTFKNTRKGSISEKSDILTSEIETALKIAGNPEIKKFKIVADAANAMGAQYIDALFDKIPADLIKMNFELDGTFPAHQPNPLEAETLIDLQKTVLSEKADLGLAPDGDGDRLFFVDEKGKVLPASIITAIVARDLLKRFKGETVLYDIRYTLTPQKIIEENQGKSFVTRVGHAFITESLTKTGGIFGGESSGHFFFRDTGNAESQLPIILIVLKVMSEEGKKLSEIAEEVKRSYESGEVNFKVEDYAKLFEKIKENYKAGKLSVLDGVSISFPEWSFSLRASNTEPLVRLNVESYFPKITEDKKNELINFINKFVFNEKLFDKSNFITSSFLKKVKFPWGYELIWVPEGKNYLGKIIHINKGKRLSLQVHDQKDESWFLIEGEAKIFWENKDGEIVETKLLKDQGYSCVKGQKHRLVGMTDCDIVEVSTPEVGTTYHLEDDYERGGSGKINS